ncbi:MAG TPA: pirin family protein [Thermoanaerobaculia bacterium]
MNEPTRAERSILAVHRGRREDIADLVTRQAIPNRGLSQLDPFLLLNHHGPQIYPPGNRGLPFGPHPHRGFETVTFIVDGAVLHRDTGGHESTIRTGGVQWMTAGQGLEHAEVSPPDFLDSGGLLDILQLWVNLPARLKMVEPNYIGLQDDEIPSIELVGGVTVKLISGEWGGARGPVDSLTDVLMATVAIKTGSRLSLPVPSGRTALLYVVRGSVRAGGSTVDEFHLAEVADDGDHLIVEATRDALLIFGHASPLGEPVVAHGPFVMNTHEEIAEAIDDYRSGKFAGKTSI